jgi:pyridoxal phosphate-dependent aminotransferase EpsN
MLVSRDRRVVERARHLSNQARDDAPHYEHSEIGFNYRLSNLLAAVGRAQLKSLPDKVDRRRAINRAYREALGPYPGVSFMREAGYGRSNGWLTCLTVDPTAFGASREDIRRRLQSMSIESRPVWKPMHLQPVYRKCSVRGGAVAAGLFETGLCLPSGSGLAPGDQARIVEAIDRVHRFAWSPSAEWMAHA